MEEILKQIIDIDKNARDITKEEKERKGDIDNYIEEQYKTKKTILDLEYKEEIEKQKEKCEIKLEQEKKEIEEKINEEINIIQSQNKVKLGDIIQSIIDSIEEEEE